MEYLCTTVGVAGESHMAGIPPPPNTTIAPRWRYRLIQMCIACHCNTMLYNWTFVLLYLFHIINCNVFKGIVSGLLHCCSFSGLLLHCLKDSATKLPTAALLFHRITLSLKRCCTAELPHLYCTVKLPHYYCTLFQGRCCTVWRTRLATAASAKGVAQLDCLLQCLGVALALILSQNYLQCL